MIEVLFKTESLNDFLASCTLPTAFFVSLSMLPNDWLPFVFVVKLVLAEYIYIHI